LSFFHDNSFALSAVIRWDEKAGLRGMH